MSDAPTFPAMYPVRKRSGTPTELFAMLFTSQDELDRYAEYLHGHYDEAYEIGEPLTPVFEGDRP